jgi:hypothetical protein
VCNPVVSKPTKMPFTGEEFVLYPYSLVLSDHRGTQTVAQFSQASCAIALRNLMHDITPDGVAPFSAFFPQDDKDAHMIGFLVLDKSIPEAPQWGYQPPDAGVLCDE